MVHETGVPLRFYLPREDIDAALLASETTAVCPYKGIASYWSLDGLEDAAWSYDEPLESMLTARGKHLLRRRRRSRCWRLVRTMAAGRT